MPEKHDIVELEIHDIAYGGDGVGRLPDGMTVFVPFAALGDHLKVKLYQVKKRFARGGIQEILAPSPHRIKPRCPLFQRCGGCQYQHLRPAAERDIKVRQLAALLQRVGGLQDIPDIETPIHETPVWNYRNKVSLHPGKNGPGFLALDNKTVVNVKDCPIARPGLNQRLSSYRDARREFTLREDARGLVCEAVRGSEAWLTEELLGHEVKVPLTGFYQVNPPVLDAICSWLKEVLASFEINGFLDAYCGVGVFSLALAEFYRTGIGIEAHPDCITYANANAEAWGNDHVDFFQGPVENHLGRCLRHAKEVAPTCVLLDPPRAGCSPKVINQVCHHVPDTLVYLACDPAMLARDLKKLTGTTPLTLTRLAVFNMFPQTAHFESIAILRKPQPGPA